MRLFQFAILVIMLFCFTSCQSIDGNLSIANNESLSAESDIKEISGESLDCSKAESTNSNSLFIAYEESSEATAPSVKENAESIESITSVQKIPGDELSVFDGINNISGLDGSVIGVSMGNIDNVTQTIGFDNFTFYRDATGLSFEDNSCLEAVNEWHKIDIGDKFGSLTVSSAYSRYTPNGKRYENTADLSETDANWCERKISFDGTVTLDGIITANLNNGEYWANALFFQADPESLKEQEFPMLKSIAFCWNRDIMPYGKSAILEDTEVFYLGSIEQYSDLLALQNYADNDGFLMLHVTADLSNIALNYNIATSSTPCGKNTANLCSVLISSDQLEVKSVNDNSDKANYVTPSDLSEPFTNGSFAIQEPISPWNEKVPDKTLTDAAESSSETEYIFGDELFCESYSGI